MPRGKTEKTLELIRQARAIYKSIHPASVRAGCYQQGYHDGIELDLIVDALAEDTPADVEPGKRN